jgi:hypothetical protein
LVQIDDTKRLGIEVAAIDSAVEPAVLDMESPEKA